MKQIFILCVITLLLAANVYAQSGDEYLYNPRLAMSGDDIFLRYRAEALLTQLRDLGARYPIDFYEMPQGTLINSFNGSEDSIMGLALSPDGHC